jgi:TetR/AcrR family transcriptional repressor of nem operon
MNNKLQKKNDILKKSIGAMYLKGYNGTSVKDITDAAGVPKGSFYTYFKDKEHYAVDAVEYYEEYIVKEKLMILEDKNLKPLVRIVEFYKKSIDNFNHSEYIMGCFAGNLSQEMGELSDDIKASLNKFHSDVVEKIYNNLVEAKDNNELSSKLELKVLASFIANSWQGTILRTKVSSNNDLLDEFLLVLETVLLK